MTPYIQTTNSVVTQTPKASFCRVFLETAYRLQWSLHGRYGGHRGNTQQPNQGCWRQDHLQED